MFGIEGTVAATVLLPSLSEIGHRKTRIVLCRVLFECMCHIELTCLDVWEMRGFVFGVVRRVGLEFPPEWGAK